MNAIENAAGRIVWNYYRWRVLAAVGAVFGSGVAVGVIVGALVF